MKILIAEDNKVSRLLLERNLKDMGFEVVVTENGRDAWDVLQGDDAPSLAVLDWMMPYMDGVDVCRKVRELNNLCPTYILLLTAKQEKEDILSAFEAGADDYIVKPFDRDELMARVKVGQRLVEKQVLLNSLIDSIPDVVFFQDTKGAYLGCNPAFANMVGKPRAEIIGKHIDSDNAFFRHCSSLVERVMNTYEPVSFEEQVYAGTQDERLFTNILAPIKGAGQSVNGVIGICHDITERSQMESEHRRLAKVIEQSTEAIAVTDTEGDVEYVNSAFEALTGYSRAEIIGESIRVLKSGKHDVDFYQKLWEKILNGKTWSGHFMNLRKDGSFFEAESMIFPVRNRKEEIVNFVGMMRDVTQERLLAEQLRQAQKMNAVGQLAGGVAHDFNNLLMVIRNSAQFIKSAIPEDTESSEDATAIIDAAGRAATLTRQLLAFSRKQILDTKQVDLNNVLPDLRSMLSRLVPENIRIEIKLSDEPCLIRADIGQLEQVVMNMAINARDAMPGGGCLSIETRTEEIDSTSTHAFIDVVKDGGAYAVLIMSDTGVGIDRETQRHIFEPFFTTKGVGKGTGLGLSTAYGIIKQHDGHVSVYSEPGEGTTFKIYLPLQRQADGSEVDEEQAATKGGTETILLVEDEPFVLNIGVRMLQSLGYTVYSASNGVEALSQLEQQPAVDLLFTDVVMPEMDGTELAQKVREARPEIKILFASGYSEFHIKESGLLDDAANLLQKPYELAQVAEKIRQVLEGD